jgi:hypothetical protein
MCKDTKTRAYVGLQTKIGNVLEFGIAHTFEENYMPSPYEQLIRKAYAAFNARDIDTALSTMHENIQWPKAFEGGYVTGKEAIREYWTRQWNEINPNVEPAGFKAREDGSLEILVHQKVKDLEGNILFDGAVKHIYSLEDGLLRRMDIEPE